MTDRGDATRQFVGLDVLRLIAALLVAVYHFGFWRQTAVDDSLVHVVEPGFAAMTKSLTHFGWVGVEIFFVISGFVITLSAQNASPSRFFRGRFLRIAPAVWICAPITLLIYHSTLGTPIADMIAPLIRTLSFFPLFSYIDGVYWTLGVEISFYALVFVLLKLSRLDRIETVAIGLGAISLMFWIAALTALAVVGDDPGRWGVLARKAVGFRIFQLLLIQHGCFFGLGVLAFAIQRGGLSPRRILAMALLLIACWLEIIGQNGIIARAAQLPLSPAPALAFWTCAFAGFLLSLAGNARLHRLFDRQLGVIRRIGLLTYPFYLLHNPVGLATILGLLNWGASAPLAIAAGLAAGLLASWAVMMWIEPPAREIFRAAIFTRRRDGELAAIVDDAAPGRR